MTTDILFERRHHLGLITLARPQALNALNLPMILALQQQLLQWQADSAIHAVVLQAEPGKAFCAGGDVRWLYETGLANDPEQLSFFWHEYRLNHFIHQFKKPYIALMDGMTMGGGVGISLHGSHSVASERFIFAMPETGIGLFPDIGASYLLARCPGQLGPYLALTGNRLRAQDAFAAGLVKHVIASENHSKILAKLCQTDLSHDAYQQVSSCLQDLEIPQQATLLTGELEKINHFFARASIKEIVSGLEESDDSWARTTFDILQKKSPLSLEVTFAQIQKAKSMSMLDCLKMDYCLVNHFMAGTDFYEGVRALLVHKDGNPDWQPDTLNKVTAAMVANYFECHQAELSLS